MRSAERRGEISHQLRSARAASGLTQRAVAARVGLTTSVVCAYERGTRVPSADTYLHLLRAMGATVQIKSPDAEQIHRANQSLQDLLDLAEMLPQRPRSELAHPVLRDHAHADTR